MVLNLLRAEQNLIPTTVSLSVLPAGREALDGSAVPWPHGLRECFRAAVRAEGVRGLYHGVSANVLKMMPALSIARLPGALSGSSQGPPSS